MFLVLKRDARAVTRVVGGCSYYLMLCFINWIKKFCDIMKYLCPIAENRDILICKILINAAEAVM